MRLLCELFLIGLLLWLGWSTSFQDWTNRMRGISPAHAAATTATTSAKSPTVTTNAPPPNASLQPFNPPAGRRAVAAPQATRAGDWMWDPGHRGTLDRPAYDSQNPSQTYQETGARRYWIDSQGNRHYQNATPPPH